MPQQYRLILKNIDQPGYTPDVDCYLRHGGYEVLKKALAIPVKELPDGKKSSPQEQIRDEVKSSGLRGRGGAGFSCGLKWSFVDRKSGKPIYLICNADESEPGTFKDRQIIYKDPHQLLEGMIISCFANDVHLAYIYIRGEMTDGAKLLNRALKEARAKNFLGKNILGSGYDLEIHVHRGAGAYICGEETGLIESLEGKRAYPRIKPPYFPAVLGLYMCPTIVNNVETLAAVKHILQMGAPEYAKLGTPNNTGTRIVSVSGHVKTPGYFEVEVGKAIAFAVQNHRPESIRTDLVSGLQYLAAICHDRRNCRIEAALAIQVNHRTILRRFGFIGDEQTAADPVLRSKRRIDHVAHRLFLDLGTENGAVKLNRPVYVLDRYIAPNDKILHRSFDSRLIGRTRPLRNPANQRSPPYRSSCDPASDAEECSG